MPTLNKYSGEKKWQVIKRIFADPIDQILSNRKINLKSKESFLKLDFDKGLFDPYKFKNMPAVIDRITVAIKQKEVIGIFADYDADGISSAVLLLDALGKLGLKSIYYIPDRIEGYGLNKTGIDFFCSQKVTLMIAVDLGVTGKKMINYAKKLNIESIVIDHHLVQKSKIPDCLVINPKQLTDKYPFKELSAGGLTYKFIGALGQKFPEKISVGQLKWWLDLVAISTIADMVPLREENRILTFFGLKVLKKTRRLGLQLLIESSGINPQEINSGTVGFQIAPRINAPGRVGSPDIVIKLLLSDNRTEGQKLAKKIELINTKRQNDLEKMLAEAREQINKNKLYNRKLILVSGKNWQPGLVGLVAGRLMDEFARPVIAIWKGDKISRGSARSIETFHLLTAFEHIAKYLKSFGGHARAGGLTLESKHLDIIYETLLNYADPIISDQDLIPKLTIDLEVKDLELSINFIKNLSQLEPYGLGNPKPLFILRQQKILSIKYVGNKQQHLKLGFKNFGGIYFNGSNHYVRIAKDDVIDIVFSPQINFWNGESKVELQIFDYKKIQVEKWISKI